MYLRSLLAVFNNFNFFSVTKIYFISPTFTAKKYIIHYNSNYYTNHGDLKIKKYYKFDGPVA